MVGPLQAVLVKVVPDQWRHYLDSTGLQLRGVRTLGCQDTRIVDMMPAPPPLSATL